MKILKIFGVVVGIHVFALILIFANPGCSSTNKPAAGDTVSQAEPTPEPVTAAPASTEVPPTIVATDSPVTAASPISAAPIKNDMASSAVVVRFSPTRPGTAAAAALESQPVGDVTPATTYTVLSGDSLWSIAKKNHIAVADLAAANNLKSSAMVKIGQRLIIPSKTASMDSAKAMDMTPAKPAAVAPTATAGTSGESVKHTVRPGETLGAIARKYQVKVGDIATANNIADPAKIRPGMVLTIPGRQASGAKSTTGEKPGPEVVPAGPAPGQDLDSGVKSNTGEPPVIQVEDGATLPEKP